MLFVDTVDTKIKACNPLNSVCYIVCQHYWHKDICVCGSYTSTVYRVMRCENSTLLCIQRPLAPPGGKACTAFHLVGLAVYQSEEAALITLLDLSTTRVIVGKTHRQSPILKLTKGVLSNLLILKYLLKQSCILHTLTKKPSCNLELKSALQCLKNMGLYSPLGGGRFSFWQSWLTWASRLANSQVSALNAGVLTALNSPESNCSYLAHI